MGIIVSKNCHFAGQLEHIQLYKPLVTKAVSVYYTYQIPPMMDENNFKFFIMLAFNGSGASDEAAISSSQALWTLFSSDKLT